MTPIELPHSAIESATTVEDEVRRQVASELEKSMALKNPGGWPDYDEITESINSMDNARFLWYISEAIEKRLATDA
jgi:3-deoxy-D-arabino-heptulosonate 7-phosphate (DAHP) synthase